MKRTKSFRMRRLGLLMIDLVMPRCRMVVLALGVLKAASAAWPISSRSSLVAVSAAVVGGEVRDVVQIYDMT